MKTLPTFFVLSLLKIISLVFYHIKITWVAGSPHSFHGTKLIVLLNHTSLFEPIYLATLPLTILWEIAKKGVLPGADITMKRPFVGWFFRLVSSSTVPVSRRRDKSWKDFLDRVKDDSLVVIAAEGRMKRPNGLDKHGDKMTVRGGVADLLERMHSGKMIIAYSGGLHHVMSPEQTFPRPFKRINLALEIVDINDYKKLLGIDGNPRAFRLAVVRDLENRRDLHCPQSDNPLVNHTLKVSLP